MSTLNVLTREQAIPQAREILDAVKKKIGMIPNIYAVAAHSASGLKGFLQYEEVLRTGEFTPKEVEAISLAVAEENGCRYCLAAHTVVGKMVGFSEEDTIALRGGTSADPKLRALTALAREIAATRGYPSQDLIDQFFSVGYSKGALVELLGFVALNIFKNYLNHIAETQIDFPAAKELTPHVAA